MSVRVASNSEYNVKLEELRSAIRETNAKIDLNVKYINETGKVVAIVQNQQERIGEQLKELNEWLRKQDTYHGSVQ